MSFECEISGGACTLSSLYLNSLSELHVRGGIEDNFSYFSMKIYFVTPH